MKRQKQKKKSPSTLARDPSQIKAFWKIIKSTKKSHAARNDATQPRLDLPSSISEVVKEHTHIHLTNELDND